MQRDEELKIECFGAAGSRTLSKPHLDAAKNGRSSTVRPQRKDRGILTRMAPRGDPTVKDGLDVVVVEVRLFKAA